MNAIFGMLFLLMTLLRQSMGLLPLRQQAAESCTKNLLVPQTTPTRIVREGRVGTCTELSPERSWFRLLANGWPVPIPAFSCTSFASLAALRLQHGQRLPRLQCHLLARAGKDCIH